LVKWLRSRAVDNCRNNGVTVDTVAGEVSHVNHGANMGDRNVCLGLVSVGYVHAILRMSS
jgi:hypothetical protein